ncbi:hypothetical protein SAMN05428997_15312 [Bosea sp. CRIB-10]|uniref:hypothetical protein n=1 Tax=Bosea sp. CRIB-10 TaxID=378404 RepID=UPI0008F0DB54|nr:hypothetical protein [Bosea sp. CRIB-10]SFD76402.1 hypothetical protein SAMN05428997_15312 [Bosea sp. CRIB-10]
MKLYRAKWNVLDDTGKTVAPGGEAKLDASALALIAAGAIEPDPIGDVPPPSEDERLAAVLAIVPGLAVGDFTNGGQLRAEARRRIAAELGFEPSDDEIRAAADAYAKAGSRA